MNLDSTELVDQFLTGYEPAVFMTWTFIAVILIGIISLGAEFWVNLWGIIYSPALTFQRILGEAQTVPGIVVTLVAGAAAGVITLAYILNPPIIEWAQGQDLTEGPLAQLLNSTDEILNQSGWDNSLGDIIIYWQDHVFQWWIIAVIIPVNFIINWGFMGLAGQVSSMIAGNKAGHGVTNLWAAVPYMYLVAIPIIWFQWMWFHGSLFASVMLCLFAAWYFFLFVIMMREHGRYALGKAIFATILTPILTVIFSYLAMVLAIIAFAQISKYV